MIQPHEHVFDLSGGRLSLNFVNTVGGMRGVSPNEHLHSYEELLRWALQIGVLSQAHADRLAEKAARSPGEAAKAFARAIELREALYRVWLARTQQTRPTATDLELVSSHARRAFSKISLIDQGACDCTLAWAEEDDLEAPLWPIAKEAVELLTGPLADRVRQCEAGHDGSCSWIFLDETKNRSRRWCSMGDCGNRAKARRHYARTKGAKPKAG